MKTRLFHSMKRFLKILGIMAITVSLNSCLKNSAKPILQVPDVPAGEIGQSNNTGTQPGSTGELPKLDTHINPIPGTNSGQNNPPTIPQLPGSSTDGTGSVDKWDGLSHDIGPGLTIE